MSVIGKRPWVYIWWLVLLQGIASLVVGSLLVISPGMTTTVLVQLLGSFWLVMGILAIVGIFVGTVGVHWSSLLLRGILGILGGLLVLSYPMLTAIILPTALILIIAIEGLALGVLGIIEGLRGGGWIAVAGGIFSLVVGIILLSAPLVAAVVLVVVSGIVQLMRGIGLIVIGFRLRKMARAAQG